MAIVYTYPIGSPAAGDLLVGTKTPVEGEAFEPNKTLNFTVQSIIDLVDIPGKINGTVGKIPVFTEAHKIGDSIITQSNGKIGIGINASSSKLEVSGDISIYNTGVSSSLKLTSSSTASGGNYIHAKKSDGSNQWVLGSNSTSDDRVVLRQYNESDMIFQNNGGDRVVITSSGNVGIGTTSPSQKLHVDGSARVTGGYYDSSNSQGTSGKVLSSTGSGTSWIDIISASGTLLDNRVPRITSANTLATGTIRDDGYGIGIKTAATDNVLTVTSDLGIGNDGIFIKDPFAGESRFVSSNNPMLSLGTSTDAGSTATIFMGSSSVADGQSSKIEYNKDGGNLTIAVMGMGTFRNHVQFGSPAYMAPRSVFFGNVGINTTQPQSELDVTGNIRVSGTTAMFSGNVKVLEIFSAGNNAYIKTGTSGGTVRFGAPAANTTNISVQGKSSAEELESTESDKGLILKSPDGTKYRVTVANGGTLSVSAV